MSAEKVAHTPGPWIFDEESTLASIWARMSPSGHGIPGRKVAAVIGDDAETEANAHLIASAPDLLALAKRYASECSDAGLDNNHILEVIRKAEGK